MLGFDKPTFKRNDYFRCMTMEVWDPCGQWKLIKGNSEYSCLVGALKWAKVNWKTINRERQVLVDNWLK